MESYSRNTKWILITSVLVSVMFGVGAGIGLVIFFEENNTNQIVLPEFINGNEYVSIRQQCTSADHIVQQGWIDCTVNIPYEIPYNIEEADLADWSIVCEVMGGYEPLSTQVTLYQEVNGQTIWLGLLKVEWEHTFDPGTWPVPSVGCTPDIWTGTFHLWDCNNPILSWSSYYPEMLGDCIILGDKSGLLEDVKPVDIVINTNWEGCTPFDVILIQENLFSINPTPNKFSSSMYLELLFLILIFFFSSNFYVYFSNFLNCY
ncbi:MAG: hypothetical protein ACFFBP_06355 [Promethearchaeota archaeon]